MTLRQFEAFLAVARVRSFRRAAETLHLLSDGAGVTVDVTAMAELDRNFAHQAQSCSGG